MKYFNNISNAEDIKKRFRELSISLHPDRGGNAEEFAAMLAEYNELCKRFEGAQNAHNVNPYTRIFVRGLKMECFAGYGLHYVYIVTGLKGDTVEYVAAFDRDFQSVEDVEMYERSEVFSKEKAQFIRPLSKKFGIGLYYDDIDCHIYTEQEIKEYEERARHFEHWEKVKKEEEARKAAEEKAKSEALERIAINEWRARLRTIPEGAKDATRKAALKHNIKAIFAHYFPGVKVSVTDTSKCWCEESAITWTDGPTVEEVENIAEFDRFISRRWESDPYADYGHHVSREGWNEWRKLFGAWSDDRIKFERKLSEDAAAAFRAELEAVCPQFVGVPDSQDVRITDEGHDTDLDKLYHIVGLDWINIDYNTATEEERRRHDERNDARRRFHDYIGKGWLHEGVWLCFAKLLRYVSDYYTMAKKSQETEEQPQGETSEANTNTANTSEGVELVELDGGRIAVTGDTYAHRETLKAFGGWWNRRAQRWEFRADKAQSVRKWLAAQQPEPESAQDEPQPEPTTEAHTEPQSHTEGEQQPEPQPEPQPTTEEPTEGAKGVTISEGLAGAFAKVAAIVAAVVMVATSSAAQPEPETETAKGAKIVFSSSDTPELQEIHTDTHTDTHTEPQSTTETDTATADRLDALNLARLKAQSLTEENEHTAALFAELEALAACGVDVADILRDLHALDDEHRRRGYITAGELQQRQFMRDWAQHRAASILTASEYNALFGQEKAA